MNTRLREIAEYRYNHDEFLKILFELALEEQWFALQHMVQHDMAKAIIADYCYESGEDYLSSQKFFDHWEDIIKVGWDTFCRHTGLPMEKVSQKLTELRNLH